MVAAPTVSECFNKLGGVQRLDLENITPEFFFCTGLLNATNAAIDKETGPSYIGISSSVFVPKMIEDRKVYLFDGIVRMRERSIHHKAKKLN